jgi:ankyrin repeat protein
MLVRHQRVAVDARDTLGLTPLLYAASKGHRVAVEILLNTGQVDVNSYKVYGCVDWFWSGGKL